MNIKYFQLENIYIRIAFKISQIFISNFYPSKILNGNFKNTPLIKNWVGSSMLPKILGTYESEAADELLNILVNENIDSVIDIGCAGGYYLAIANHLNPELDLVGIDISSKAELQIRKYNNKFGTSIFFIKGYADNTHLINFAMKYKRPLFIIDIEGGEYDLLNFNQDNTIFKNSFFFIESHEFKNLTNFSIKNKFSKTHNIVTVDFNFYDFYNFKMPNDLYKLIKRHELRDINTKYLFLKPIK
jgi:SAM-dependent methyltransferase